MPEKAYEGLKKSCESHDFIVYRPVIIILFGNHIYITHILNTILIKKYNPH